MASGLPVSFKQTVPPLEVTIPDGPFEDGQRIPITLEGFARDSKVRAICTTALYQVSCGESEPPVVSEATGTITKWITLTKVDSCTDPATTTCQIRVSTKPLTSNFSIPIVFE